MTREVALPSGRVADLVAEARASLESGRYDLAATFVAAALERAPSDVAARLVEARVSRSVGDVSGAARVVDGILASDPAQGAAWRERAVLDELVRDDRAMRRALVRAAALGPELAGTFTLLALSCRRRGDLRAAIGLNRQALRLDEACATAAFNLGTALLADARLGEAARAFRRALATDPAQPEAHYNLAQAMQRNARPGAAARACRRALALMPDWPQALGNLGAALADLDDLDAAAAICRRALARAPGLSTVHSNLALIHHECGRSAAAEAAFRRALALVPGDDRVRYNLAFVRLDAGDLAAGYRLYDAGLRTGRRDPWPRPTVPTWAGEDAAGRRILVAAEQGLGDEIRFAAAVPALAARAEAVALACDARLASLFRRSFPGVTILPRGEAPPPCSRSPGGAQRNPGPSAAATVVPDCASLHPGYEIDSKEEGGAPPGTDLRVAAGSLARRLWPSLADYPSAGGYLVPDPARVAGFRRRLAALGPGLKVGIAWRSRTESHRVRATVTRLEDWRPVLGLPGIRFVSLQYDGPSEAAGEGGSALFARLHRWADVDLLHDMEAAAALTASLDLVISVATSVNDMAGAVGTECWLVWRRRRGLLGTSGQPVYPRHRVFGWWPGEPRGAAVAAVHAALAARVNVARGAAAGSGRRAWCPPQRRAAPSRRTG